MGIEKRLQLIMVSNRMSASSFADKIGVQRSNVSHILNGRNKPGYDFLLKVIHAFPKVNTHWLLTGDEKIDESIQLQNLPLETIDEKESVVSLKEVQDNLERNPEAKRIIKTVIFYDDFTFDAFLPSEK